MRIGNKEFTDAVVIEEFDCLLVLKSKDRFFGFKEIPNGFTVVYKSKSICTVQVGEDGTCSCVLIDAANKEAAIESLFSNSKYYTEVYGNMKP